MIMMKVQSALASGQLNCMDVIEKIKCPSIFDLENPRKVFGKFATGVCILLVDQGEGFFRGLTVNSFSSVSLEPLLILFSIKTKSLFFERINGFRENFSINILQTEQMTTSKECSKPGGGQISAELVQQAAHTYYLKNSLASLECTIYAEVTAGDHTIFICNVHSMMSKSSYDPLLFYNSEYKCL